MVFFEISNPDLISAKNAVLADNWWALALRGLFAIVFGIIAFAMPAAAMLALVLIFGAYSIADGIVNIVLAVRGARSHERWGLLLINGLLGIAIGIPRPSGQASLCWPLSSWLPPGRCFPAA